MESHDEVHSMAVEVNESSDVKDVCGEAKQGRMLEVIVLAPVDGAVARDGGA